MIDLEWEEALELRRRLAAAADPAEIRATLFGFLGLDRFLAARRIVRVGELPLHCEVYEADRQDAPLLLFLPGIGTYVEMYCELLWGLARHGFHVAGVDPRGHGSSGGERGHYRVAEVARDLSAVIDRLGRDYPGPVGVIGSSMGARLGLAAAERDPRVRALLCHTLFLAEYPPDPLHWLGWNSLACSELFLPGARVGLRSFVDIPRLLRGNPLSLLMPHDDKMVWQYPLATLASAFTAPSRVVKERLDFPAALLIGERDELVDTGYAAYLVRRLSHPFELLVLPDAGHMLPFERPAELLGLAVPWLRSALGDGGRAPAAAPP